MVCAYTRPRYQVSVYRTIGPLVVIITDVKIGRRVNVRTPPTRWLRTTGFRGLRIKAIFRGKNTDFENIL